MSFFLYKLAIACPKLNWVELKLTAEPAPVIELKKSLCIGNVIARNAIKTRE